MLRFGIISEIDASKGLARVSFEEDDFVSDWLPVSVPNSLKNKDEVWFDVNEPVWCIMDENLENGIIGGAYYHAGNLPAAGDENIRSVTFEDGTSVQYDRSSHTLTIQSEGNITIEAPEVSFSGNLSIDGDLSVTQDVSITGGLHATGEIESNTQVKVGVIALTTHKHGGVTTGGGISAIPVP